MKKARKFLAMMLCLTLCIVPLPFSVHAQDFGISLLDYTENVNCPNCGSVHYCVIEFSASYTDNYVGTASVCFKRTYAAVRLQCDDCHWLGTEYNVSKDYTHPTLIYCTETRGQNEITAWHCPACTYYHN